jgi:hypothetical protein
MRNSVHNGEYFLLCVGYLKVLPVPNYIATDCRMI